MIWTIRGMDYSWHLNVENQIEEPDKNSWHCRFGHLGMNSISKLINDNMAEGMNCSDHGKESS